MDGNQSLFLNCRNHEHSQCNVSLMPARVLRCPPQEALCRRTLGSGGGESFLYVSLGAAAAAEWQMTRTC